MISSQQIQLNVCTEFIQQYMESFGIEPPNNDEARFLLVLRLRQWQLRRLLKGDILKLEHLPHLKHGIRTAELILHDLADEHPSRATEYTALLLHPMILEFTKEVVRTEERFPHLKGAFDRERAEYRATLAGAEQALQLD